MKIPPALHILSLWLLVMIIGTALTMTRADANELPEPPHTSTDVQIVPETEPATALEEDSLDADVSPMTSSQCASGYFCVWTEANYTGTIQRFKTQSQYMSISTSQVGSFYNNRSKRVFLYATASGATSACYGARVKRSSTSGWVSSAKGTYLSTATSC